MSTRNRWALLTAIAGVIAMGACSNNDNGPDALTAPTGLSTTAIGQNEVSLSWNAVTGATGYQIERSGVGGSFSQVGTATTTSYTDTGLQQETVYTYRVKATRNSETSAASDPLTVETQGEVALDPPTNVQAEELGETLVHITWTAAANATGYRVQRAEVGGNFADVADVGAVTEYTDEGLTHGTSYLYQVQSLLDGRVSASSQSASVTTQPWVELVGNINNTRTLHADSTYLLKGVVQIQDGGKIVIPPGTTVRGDKGTQGALLVLQGGIIDAQGTASDPIVFTSSLPDGERTKGDWGGVIINGYSNCNFPQDECLGEGNTGKYGGTIPDDSSGVMTYVRIEFAGIEFSADNELNGLTLNGVGSKTVLHHIQSHAGLDDGVEWFGGTVDLKYGIVSDASDDSFDWSTGWQGRGQFWIVQQDPNDADQGWEIDNNEKDFESLPRTYGTVYNFTLVGRAEPNPGSNTSDLGIQFRRGYSGLHSCGIVMGFGDFGLTVDDAATHRLATNDSLRIENTIFFENGRDKDGWTSPGINFSDAHLPDFDDAAWVLAAGKNNSEQNPMLTDPYNRDTPNFAPMAGSPALNAGCTPPNDGFFDQVSYFGAVADAGDTWYTGWTAFPDN